MKIMPGSERSESDMKIMPGSEHSKADNEYIAGGSAVKQRMNTMPGKYSEAENEFNVQEAQ
jgi:hypothetical protein